MSARARVAVVGLGPIGLEVARVIVADGRLELVAASDLSPALTGKPLATLVPGAPPDVFVDGSVGAALGRGVDAVALCTRSKIDEVTRDLAEIVDAGAHVVTTCEELAAPPRVLGSPSPPALERVDAAARAAGLTVLATGVNPGFVMDRWPVQLAALCQAVRGVKVERIVDAGKRRGPLQRKVGYGLSAEEFRAGILAGTLGHVGLRASAALVAYGLGSTLADARETVDPVTDEGGRVLGVRQHLAGRTADRRPIELHLEMYVGAQAPHDRVVLDSEPPVDARIDGGLHGDRATVAAVVEGLRRVVGHAPRGVVSVVDVY